MNHLVSVITSAYNAEKTLSQAIKSVLNQSYSNFEYIIINHGSTDKTGEIIDHFALLDCRIKVIEIEKNSGFIGKALNEGLVAAQGEYICFLDADDQYNKGYLQIMLDAVITNNADVAVCNFRWVYYDINSMNNSNNVFSYADSDLSLLTNEKDYSNFYTRNKGNMFFAYCNVWWNKLYSVKYLHNNNILFCEDRYIYGDAWFNSAVFSGFPRIKLIDYIGINWFQYHNSTRKQYILGFYKEVIDYFLLWQERLKFIYQNNIRKKKELYLSFIPEMTSFCLMEHSNENLDDLLNDLYKWVMCETMKDYSSVSGEYVPITVNIELIIILLKEKYNMKSDGSTMIHRYYNMCLDNKENMENYLTIFDMVFQKENMYSLGVQSLVDYL